MKTKGECLVVAAAKDGGGWERLRGASPLPVVVSYYTDGFYAREAYELVRTLQGLSLDYSVSRVADLGTWERNTSFKPSFLLEQSRRFPERALLWLDADARVRKVPSLFATLDAVLAYRTWRRRPASGTVYLAAGSERTHFLEQWVRECREHPTQWDQDCMGRAEAATGIAHLELPVEYCWIFDAIPETGGQRETPDPIGDPVIEHLQASRIYRKRCPKCGCERVVPA